MCPGAAHPLHIGKPPVATPSMIPPTTAAACSRTKAQKSKCWEQGTEWPAIDRMSMLSSTPLVKPQGSGHIMEEEHCEVLASRQDIVIAAIRLWFCFLMKWGLSMAWSTSASLEEPISASQPLSVLGWQGQASILTWAWGSHSSPCTCMGSTLPTEPSP